MAIKLGGNGADTLTGTNDADFIAGRLNNDVFKLLNGNDIADGWFGDDRFIVGKGNAYIRGGAGTDTVEVGAGQWSISFLSYGPSASLINLVTGQTVALETIEQVKIGSTLVKFVDDGSKGNTITGVAGANFIKGNGGADIITTKDGNDWVNGGEGADTIKTGGGNDIIEDQDYLNTVNTTNSIDAGSGNDLMFLNSDYAGFNKYKVVGGSGTDVVNLTAFKNIELKYDSATKVTTLYTEAANGNPKVKIGTFTGVEQINSAQMQQSFHFSDGKWVSGAVVVNNTAGTLMSETIKGTSGNNTLNGGGGEDTFLGGKGTDTVVLAGRAEMYYTDDYSAKSSLNKTATLFNYEDERNARIHVGFDIEKLVFQNGSGSSDDTTFNFKVLTGTSTTSAGTSGNDFVIVDPGSSALAAGSKLVLQGGDDYVTGHGAIVSADAGTGDDRIFWSKAAKNAAFHGGDGDDLIYLNNTSSKLGGAFVLDGGKGNDTLQFAGADIAKISGGDGDDRLSGVFNSVMSGGAGNDLFNISFYSSDTKAGSFDGGSGADLLTLSLSSQYIITKTSGVTGGFTIFDKESEHTVSVKSIEAVAFLDRPLDLTASFSTYKGTASANTKVGGDGIDLMHGGDGKDALTGGAGDDTLAGDAGNDTLKGGDGNDVLNGGDGDDKLTGNAGVDLFLFHGYNVGDDTITDFHAGKGAGDAIALIGGYGTGSFSEIMGHATDVGDDTVFTFGSDFQGTITVENVHKADFVADDFQFL